MRMRQVHDLWHVLSGYPADVLGELGLQAFQFAQLPSALSASLIASGILHFVRSRPGELAKLMQILIEGYTRGKNAKFLLSRLWQEDWGRPLAQVREEMAIVIE